MILHAQVPDLTGFPHCFYGSPHAIDIRFLDTVLSKMSILLRLQKKFPELFLP